jgi:hypothetical protein
MKTESLNGLLNCLIEEHGPWLRKLGRARERIKAMNKKRLELAKANNSLKKKLREFKLQEKTNGKELGRS